MKKELMKIVENFDNFIRIAQVIIIGFELKYR